MAPVSGLLAHCLEECSPRPDLRMARISYDILGLIPREPFEVQTRVLRPGRTIELLQAELIAGGRPAVRATAWRLARGDTAGVSGLEDAGMPGPDEAAGREGLTSWPGAFVGSVEQRALPGVRPGRGRAWNSTPHDLVEDAAASDLSRLIGLVDLANGVATRVQPGGDSWMFPNVDLQVHMYREPRGDWLGLDTSVTFGAGGVGLTSSVLHDLEGPFGRSEQILTVRPLGGA